MKKLRKFLNRFRLPALVLASLLAFSTASCSGGLTKSPEDLGAQVADDVGLARASAFLVVQAASDTLYAVTSKVTTKEEAAKIAVAEDLSFNALYSARKALEIASAHMDNGNAEKAKEYILLALSHSESVFTLIGVAPPEEAANAMKFLKGYLGAK